MENDNKNKDKDKPKPIKTKLYILYALLIIVFVVILTNYFMLRFGRKMPKEIERIAYPSAFLALFIAMPILTYFARKEANKINDRCTNEVMLPKIKSEISSFISFDKNCMSREEFYAIGFYNSLGYENNEHFVMEIDKEIIDIYPTKVTGISVGGRPDVMFDGYIARMKIARKELPNLLIKNRNLIDSIHEDSNKKNIETHNDFFDSKFFVITDDDENVKKIVSERLMNYLSEIERQNNFTRLSVRKEEKNEFKCEMSILNNNLYLEYCPRGGKGNFAVLSRSTDSESKAIIGDIRQTMQITKEIFDIINTE